jgi:hypothetical protein
MDGITIELCVVCQMAGTGSLEKRVESGACGIVWIFGSAEEYAN